MAEHTQRGGARVGKSYWFALRASGPLVSLQVNDNEITLNMPLKGQQRFLKNEITKLSLYRELFGTSLRIEHNNKSLSPFVLFKPRDLRGLTEALAQSGYTVAG